MGVLSGWRAGGGIVVALLCIFTTLYVEDQLRGRLGDGRDQRAQHDHLI